MKASYSTTQALSDEVRELKATVAASSNRRQPQPGRGHDSQKSGDKGLQGEKGKLPWNVVVRKKGRLPSMQGVQDGVSKGESAKDSGPRKSQRKRTPIEGARRVWGSVKSATSVAVKATIQRFSTVGGKLSVRRKYRMTGDNPARVTKWWFVIRGDEEDLQTLQKEWPQVATQTAWKLEPLYRYDVPPNTSDNNNRTSNLSPNESAAQHSAAQCSDNSETQQPQLPTQQQQPATTEHAPVSPADSCEQLPSAGSDQSSELPLHASADADPDPLNQ